ncbi:hypothetical protein L1D40_13515 [Shewanella insulae]|uniref:hypothetical protein n=1 Tax=Shewanella insulae TaxID=2681496 RepID=UPI001EFD5AA5|nr:hypothetical protein [Shewanella insulae]MCG9756229.1 hypothetical protein [Shewanella insulae]
MKIDTTWLGRLKWLLLATFLSSILHYVDNILFFADYPEPVWINPSMVDLFWFFMTPLAPLGYLQLRRGNLHLSVSLLVLYGLSNMLTLGHYNYAPLMSIDSKIHLFILLEAVLGALVVAYVLWGYSKRYRTSPA